MPSNVKYPLNLEWITTLYEAMIKSIDMERHVLESNVSLEIILIRVQGEVSRSSISTQFFSSYRGVEERGVGRGIFQGHPPNE
jgi:hypothetical protein